MGVWGLLLRESALRDILLPSSTSADADDSRWGALQPPTANGA